MSAYGTTRKWPAVWLASASDRFSDHIRTLLRRRQMTRKRRSVEVLPSTLVRKSACDRAAVAGRSACHNGPGAKTRLAHRLTGHRKGSTAGPPTALDPPFRSRCRRSPAPFRKIQRQRVSGRQGPSCQRRTETKAGGCIGSKRYRREMRRGVSASVAGAL
jgi:hypothetical protein